MKKLILFVFLSFSGMCFAQESSTPIKTEADSVYNVTVVDKAPDFPGGIKEFYKYIGENFNPPSDKEFKGGKLFTSFVIEKDGGVTNIKILRDTGFGTGEEAIRVLKSSPLWIPAEENGQKVSVLYSLPIIIQAPAPVEGDNKIYSTTGIEKKPEFPGGIELFYKFIGTNFHVPEVDNFPGGKVYVSFVIEKDGSVTEAKVLRDVGFGAGAEAIRVLGQCPKWNPGMQDGKPVRVMYTLPISLQSNSEDMGFVNSNYKKTLNYDMVEGQPEFLNGGVKKFFDFINGKIQSTKENETVSKVYYSFIVDENGVLTAPQVINDNELGVREEIVSALKKSSKWKPGVHKGEIVKVKYVSSVSVPVNNIDYSNPEAIYNSDMIDKKPEFSGGPVRFFEYVKNNLKKVSDNSLKGKIYFSFVVERDGSISQVWVISNVGTTKTMIDLVEIFNESPQWMPGEIKGERIRTQLVIPIIF